MTAKAPMRLDDKFHALTRFVTRWWPLTATERRHGHARDKAMKLRADELMAAVCSRAVFVETVPDECQSIWSFVVCAGPNKGRTALMVVSFDGTVRTVLPPDTRRPTRYRPKKAKSK
jgi:hypothetical protein